MKNLQLIRYSFFIFCLLFSFISAPLALAYQWLWIFTIITSILSLIGIYDVLQTKHSVCRNYPILGHLRFLIEYIRPEIRQYLIESDTEALPFSRQERSLVYRRAKNIDANKAFGTVENIYKTGFEFISHSIRPAPIQPLESFRVTIGTEQCKQPYSASILNISAMSFGALSANAIRALNKGAKKGNFAHDSGEGGLSPYHKENGGDLIWQIASGYFGCRTAEGKFNPERFAEQAANPQIKMIEVKLSQGAKPGHGGMLPKEKVTAEIASTREVPMGQDCISPPMHSAFSTPIELLEFIAQLRELSGGKPVGFKICIGHPWEFVAIVKAILKTNIIPDFIVVDGKEGGTGDAPVEFSDHIGLPLRQGLSLVHNILVGTNLRDKIKIGASGKIISAFDIVRAIALGADWVNSARGFMFAVGCIQSQACNTNRCPTGVATQDPLRQAALVVPDKAERVYYFHQNTLKAFSEMIAATGLTSAKELKPHHIARRISDNEIRLLSNIEYYLQPGELLSGKIASPFYSDIWEISQPESFEANHRA